VTGVLKQRLGVSWQVLIELEPRRHIGNLRRDRDDAFPRKFSCICERGWNVLRFKRWVLLEDSRNWLVSRQVIENH
jgi:very-short-patch-repair endonuclease